MRPWRVYLSLMLSFFFSVSVLGQASDTKPTTEQLRHTFTFLGYAQTAVLIPSSQAPGWFKMTLYNHAPIIPYFSFQGDIVGGLTTTQFYLNAVRGLPKPDGSNVKTALLAFGSYVTNGGQSYPLGKSIVELADNTYDAKKNISIYLVRGVSGIPITAGKMTGVSIITDARINQDAASSIFILDPLLRMKPLDIPLSGLNFGVTSDMPN